jgi:hypothetical protein
VPFAKLLLQPVEGQMIVEASHHDAVLQPSFIWPPWHWLRSPIFEQLAVPIDHVVKFLRD